MSDARRILNALLWLAAFFFACGIFLGATQLLRGVPPTPHVAVGRVTVENASKLRDYLAVLLFFLIVPAATIAFYRLGARQLAQFKSTTAEFLFVVPFFLAPFLYLTTFKWGWPLIIPLAASQLGPRAMLLVERTLWLRRLLRMRAFNALVVAEALAWILFFYIGTWHRIAHVATLFLEIVFVGFFVVLFWCAFVLIARIASFTIQGAERRGRGADGDVARTSPAPCALRPAPCRFDVAFQRVAVGALPLVILPALGLRFVPAHIAISGVMAVAVTAILIALRGNEPVDETPVRNVVAYVIFPALLYCLSYASTAALTQWIDLFHRGESLGPAFDYLRGKVPYRDVFVLHGLLEDGQLDAWLFQLFGRNVDIALARPVILGSFAVAALWYVGMAIFDSIPLAAAVMLLGAVTTVDNERELWEILVLALLLGALRRRSKALFVLSGVAAGVTLFFSFDIGLYSIGGGIIVALASRGGEDAARPAGVDAGTTFLLGTVLGAAPFVIYLTIRGALGAFFTTSFQTLPKIIDAVWSLPFPDLTSTFRSKNLNLHTLSDFLLYEQFRFILNPLVIGIAILVLLWRRKRWEWIDVALFALTAFAILTQRSALGRADFPHQYFSAFLIGPMILILLVLFARVGRLWVALLVPLLAFALWVPDIANGRIDDTVHYQSRVSRIGFRDPQAEEIKNRIEAVRYWVWQHSKPNQPIFDFSNQPALYFFCERPNPTRFYQVPILSPPAFQRETILALEKAKPPVVIRRSPQEFDVFDGIDNAIRAQAVAAYLDDFYSFAHTTRGVEVWVRKSPAPRLNLAGYLRRFRVPTLKELGTIGARSRLVFPTVGTVPGVGGAYWRSDLMLHNPFKGQIYLELRYVAGDVRAHRSVVLNGGQSVVWPDVVRSFFGAPESRGVLWIEYRGTAAPVARVKTADVAHDAKATIDAPLTLADSATAGSPVDDLTIFGLPSTKDRRINIGIVNVGAIPATFRITARSRVGQAIGKPIEEGLAEDESYTLGDLDSRLGLRLDETTSVHVSVVAGTCIAYATVVAANGDTQFIAALPSQQP
ncbi:MAG TPA: hypothetical protein VEO74_18865 [Thermoanaerobaculia bacterium]|nr:hypothetical protein [Thermoanaerobaculia bacterium]